MLQQRGSKYSKDWQKPVQISARAWEQSPSIKGPLKYLLKPLLGKNQFAVTQRTYACIGPNLDNTY